MPSNWNELRTGFLDVAMDAFQRNDSGNVPVLMMLGGFKFSIATTVYTKLTRKTAYQWPKLERYGKLAARQYVGLGDETILLPGVIYPDWRGGQGQLDNLRALASRGRPLQLIDGFGQVLGWWVVDSIEENHIVHNLDSTPRRIDFTLSIARVPDDQAYTS